jgi:hypothetical protein
MLKLLLAGTAALAIAGPTLAYAQQRSDDPAAMQQFARERAQFRPTADDVAAFADARIAALKAGLRLTPEQERNWPAVEAAIRDAAKQRADRMRERAARADERRKALASADLIERLRGRADAMTETASSLKRLADASEPLYRSLDDDQKRRFAMLSRRGLGGHWQGMR